MNGDGGGGGGGGPGPGGASFHFSGAPGGMHGVDPRKIFEQFFGTGDPFAAGDDDDGGKTGQTHLNFIFDISCNFRSDEHLF